MINLIECLDQVGMLFLSDLSHQECTKYTSQHGFDVPDSPTCHGEEKKVFADNKDTMEAGHQMCRTRDRTAFRVRGKDQQLFAPHRVRGQIKSRTSPSTRRNHTMCLALNRVRGGQVSYFSQYADWTKQRILHSSKCSDKNSHCLESADRDLFLAEFTKRGRCDIPPVTQ